MGRVGEVGGSVGEVGWGVLVAVGGVQCVRGWMAWSGPAFCT